MLVLRLLILVLSFSLSLAHASDMAQAAGFYQGSSPLSGRDQAAREAATRAALGQVLTRMSGNVSVSVSDEAQALIAQAPRFVRSFRFAQDDIPATETEAAQTRQLLLVDFDAAALNRAARQQGLSLWDARRPVTAVWLLGPTEKGPRQLYERSRIEQRLPGLVQAAARRGLPMQYPMMDEQDQAAVSSYDVIGEDYRRLEMASARYQARHVLLLRIESRDGLWYALWSFLRADQEPLRWRSLGEDPSIALSSGFDRYADELAGLYARRVAAGWVQDTRLRVVGVNSLSAYARVLSYLENSNLVQQIAPNELNGDQVVYQLRFEGETSDLKRSLNSSGFLREELDQIPRFDFPQANDSAAPGAAPEPTAAPVTGLNFYAITADPELRYRYLE
ncbi:MAG: DUF2066 domain-containing protein [Oceanococcus sp.]